MALRDDICTAMEEHIMTAPEWSMITPAELKRMLSAHEKIYLLDVREPAEYEGGYIAGAVNIPANVLPSRAKELPQDRELKIVAYCATGRRSAYATMFLRVYGFNQVRTLAGGIRAWNASGYPLSGP